MALFNEIRRDLLSDNNVKSLSLCYSGLSTNQIKQIVELINKRDVQLDKLDLSGNNISNDGAIYLGMLRKLRYLDVCNNDIENEGLVKLLQNPSIESLNISANYFDDATPQLIVENSCQTWINVDRNGFSKNDHEKITTKMLFNRDLKTSMTG